LICDQRCETASELTHHKLTHCKITQADSCSMCRGPLHNVDDYYRHVQRHFPASAVNISCVVCKQSITGSAELQAHSTFHLGWTQRPKSITPKRPSSVVSNGSTSSKMAIPFQCIMCQQRFATEDEIKVHVTEHMLREGTVLACMLCEQRMVFDSPAKLQLHLIQHSFAERIELQCCLCSVKFEYASSLQQHLFHEHSEESRPICCPDCHQSFYYPAELQNHSLTAHAIVSPPMLKPVDDIQKFVCQHCGKAFNSNSALQGHSHVHMPHVKTHHCAKCNKSFCSSAKLRNHQRQHSNTKPFSCDICGKEFSRKDNLKVHLRTHNKPVYGGCHDLSELPTMVYGNHRCAGESRDGSLDEDGISD